MLAYHIFGHRKKAIKRANEVEFVLQNSTTKKTLLANLFNEEVTLWNKELEGIKRWLCILNYFTRMRSVNEDGLLNLKYSSNLDNIPKVFNHGLKVFIKNLNPNINCSLGIGQLSKVQLKTILLL